MLVSIFPLIALAAALAFAINGRQRYALATVLAGPVLLLALWCALFAWAALSPCEPPRTRGECEYGVAMGMVIAVVAALVWAGSAGLGWLIGWLVRRARAQPAP